MDSLHQRRRLSTAHGELETPLLFPVRNVGKRHKDNTPEYTSEIPELGVGMVNARAIREHDDLWGSIHSDSTLRSEMGVPEDTILFADSGGFDFRDGGVSLDTTPEETLETQRHIEADIYGTVDIPLSTDCRDKVNNERISENIEYALAASDKHEGDALLYASVHGYNPDTVRNGIHYLEDHGDFDGYALGSLVPIRTDYERVTKVILAARRATEKPLHVYGLGGIVYQPLLLYLGVDTFDSTSFIRSAGKRNYLVPGFGGTELHTIESLDRLPCPCPVCGARSFDEVRADRELLTRHNLWALVTELRRFRYIIESEQDIESYLDLRFEGNSVTKRAYRLAKQQVRGLA